MNQRDLWGGGVRKGRWGRSQKCHCCPGSPAPFSSESLQDWQYLVERKTPRHCHGYLKQDAQVKKGPIAGYQWPDMSMITPTVLQLRNNQLNTSLFCFCLKYILQWRKKTWILFSKGFCCDSPRENSKLMGLSPILRSIMVASNKAPKSRKVSSSSVGWT